MTTTQDTQHAVPHADPFALCRCTCEWCEEHHRYRRTDGVLMRGFTEYDYKARLNVGDRTYITGWKVEAAVTEVVPGGGYWAISLPYGTKPVFLGEDEALTGAAYLRHPGACGWSAVPNIGPAGA